MLTEDEQAIIAAKKPRIYERLGIPLDHDDEYPEPVGDLLRVLGTLPDASQERKYYSSSSIRFIHKRLLQETLWRWGPLAWSKRPTRDLERYTALLGSYPQGPEVVCNLTKGEYIRRDALKLVPEQVTLAHALISQVCWSADYSCALPVAGFEEKIERGPWAGDRFCITTVDRMPKLDAGEWVDVSAAVDQMLAVMCEHEFSDD
ncbi:hypothetical protein BN946_scf184755.g3 [Trametes cinnabarina]|uniref:Uncharacterized protein n=1 Tax=Pycnoporus cinnabarinus TaxID=5643 RepID=A0A060SDL7_PYCCI|nr:hypothetical protein BN946_scf184755.g3 [Trametes cinnabarina]